MLERMTNSTMNIDREESKGNMGLSYKNIYQKINLLLGLNTPVMISHVKAAKLLYISSGIMIPENKFGLSNIGNIDVLTIYGYIDNVDKLYDIAMLDGKPILFLFFDQLFGDDLTVSRRFSNLYSLYDLLVSMMMPLGMTCYWSSIYSTIARYAPLVLTIKTFLEKGININIDEIYLDDIRDEDKYLINESIIDAIKDIDIDNLLSFGALCEYAMR